MTHPVLQSTCDEGILLSELMLQLLLKAFAVDLVPAVLNCTCILCKLFNAFFVFFFRIQSEEQCQIY